MSLSAVISGIDGASRMSSVFGLKVRPRMAIVVAAQVPAKCRGDFARHAALPRLVHGGDGLDNAQRRLGVLRGLDQRHVSFGKHEPPKPGPACRNLRADAVVETDAAGDLLHVAADLFAQSPRFR